MPNRKIKHIVAKLVGASTEETLDVYDVDAVHTDKIYNGLDQTTSGYVLDARQGKALSDSLAVNTASPTAGTSVTINSVINARVAGMCFLSFNVSTSESINSSAIVLSNCISAHETTNGVMVNTSTFNAYSCNIRSSGEFHFGQTAPAGGYAGCIAYRFKNL